MKFKMKFFGSAEGLKSGRTYNFDKDQVIEAPEGEFEEATAELYHEEKKEVEISEGKTAETASLNHKKNKR